MQILTYICENPDCEMEDIKNFNDNLINAQWSIYKEKDLCNLTLDLMLVNNYGPLSAKKTSLKMLEYNLRKKKIADLPYHFNDFILKENQVEEIIKYCKYDSEVLKDVLEFSKDLILMRWEFGKLENLNLLNSPEPDLARKYCVKYLSESLDLSEYDFKKLKSYNDYIKGSDIILPHIKIQHISEYKEVYDFYNDLYLEANTKSNIDLNIKIISLKNRVQKTFEFNNCEYTYAAGGLHACIKPGVYNIDDEYMIEDFDKVSFYPHFAMLYGISANHIPSDVYANLQKLLFDSRKKYSKKEFPLLNHTYKIILNSLYGLSNSEYSPFYDAKATLA